jgi:hypothetical protein
MAGNRYTHNSPEWRRNGDAYDTALDPDGLYWRQRFDALIDGIRALTTAAEYQAIMDKWQVSQTYRDICSVLEPEFDRLLDGQRRSADADAADQIETQNGLRQF